MLRAALFTAIEPHGESKLKEVAENNGDCCNGVTLSRRPKDACKTLPLYRLDASLARGHQSTYVRRADGYYSRLCRVQPPGAAPEFSCRGFQRLSDPSPASAARG